MLCSLLFVNATPPSSENPYQAPSSDPTPPDPEHWRALRRQLRATVVKEQRRAFGLGVLAVILLSAAFSILPAEKGSPAAWGASAMAIFFLPCSFLAARHLDAAVKARRRVRELERAHPESSPDFFSPP